MRTRRRALERRLGLSAVVLLALSFAGDGSRAATVPAVVYGQDPLEVLELKVRPNVIIVLDSSGSMTQTTTGGGGPQHGDHPRSKMLQAKKVLRQLIQDNQGIVSFMMSQYYQVGSGFDSSYKDPGERRFQYTSTTQADILRARGDTSDRGFQSWQDIRSDWNTLYYDEAKTSGGPAVCSGSVPAGFYQRGSDLATALTTAMNAALCSPARDATHNTYTVSYDPASGSFSFAASGSNNFHLLPNSTPSNIANALGTLPATAGGTITPAVTSLVRGTHYTTVTTSGASGVDVGDTCVVTGAVNAVFNGTWSVTRIDSATQFRLNGPTGHGLTATNRGTMTCTGPPLSSGSPYTLLKSGNWVGGFSSMGMTNSFTDGTPSQTYYQIGAAHLWNGETLRVQADGYICGLTAATTLYDPAKFFVQTVGANCGTDSGDPIAYTYSGIPVTNNDDFCKGFESKVSLVPCDLQSPPAPTQFSMVSPYLDTEFAFNTDGTPKYYQEATDGTWKATRWPAADNAATPNVDEAEGGSAPPAARRSPTRSSTSRRPSPPSGTAARPGRPR